MPKVNKEELLQRITIYPKIMVGKSIIKERGLLTDNFEAVAGGVLEKNYYLVLDSISPTY